jgi:hypothetical protein
MPAVKPTPASERTIIEDTPARCIANLQHLACNTWTTAESHIGLRSSSNSTSFTFPTGENFALATTTQSLPGGE